jgi:hypothetical protein
VPTVQNSVANVYVPLLSVPEPSGVEVVESLNVTVPVAAAGATVATRLTLVPVVSVPAAGVDVSAVVVVIGVVEAVTVTDTALEVLVASFTSPP